MAIHLVFGGGSILLLFVDFLGSFVYLWFNKRIYYVYGSNKIIIIIILRIDHRGNWNCNGVRINDFRGVIWGGWGPSPPREKEKKKKRKKEKKKKRKKEKKKKRKERNKERKRTMNNVKLLHTKCCFFKFFISPVALKNLKKYWPPKLKWRPWTISSCFETLNRLSWLYSKENKQRKLLHNVGNCKRDTHISEQEQPRHRSPIRSVELHSCQQLHPLENLLQTCRYDVVGWQ